MEIPGIYVDAALLNMPKYLDTQSLPPWIQRKVEVVS